MSGRFGDIVISDEQCSKPWLVGEDSWGIDIDPVCWGILLLAVVIGIIDDQWIMEV